MRPSPIFIAALLLAPACGSQGASATQPASDVAAPTVTPARPSPPDPAPAPEQPRDREATPAGPASEPPPVDTKPPRPPPAPLPKIATWPFTAWDRAEAITYNHVPYGPGVPLRVYDAAHGWSTKIAERRPLSAEQGARAVQWVIATRGELEVSKCPFPRHAVVLYAGDTPVGTANVCFECGDILVWPEFEPPIADDPWTPAVQKQVDRRTKKQLTGYKQVFPKWERFFRDEVGFSLTPTR